MGRGRPGRPSRRAAGLGVVAFVALGLLALPPVVGSHVTSPAGPLDASAFRPIAPALVAVPPTLDPAAGAANALRRDQALVEPGTPSATGWPAPSLVATAQAGLVATPPPPPPVPASAAAAPAAAASAPAPALGVGSTGTLRGWASWYDNGTTAMRLPRGTVVRICGPAACLTRTVTDYGPDASIFPQRIVDMMPSDFATVCGCSPSKGTVYVSVTIL